MSVLPSIFFGHTHMWTTILHEEFRFGLLVEKAIPIFLEVPIIGPLKEMPDSELLDNLCRHAKKQLLYTGANLFHLEESLGKYPIESYRIEGFTGVHFYESKDRLDKDPIESYRVEMHFIKERSEWVLFIRTEFKVEPGIRLAVGGPYQASSKWLERITQE